jgi:hypothetical protein
MSVLFILMWQSKGLNIALIAEITGLSEVEIQGLS